MHVDLAFADDVDRVLAARGLGYDGQVDLLGKKLTQAGANDRVVVDDGDSDHGGGAGTRREMGSIGQV